MSLTYQILSNLFLSSTGKANLIDDAVAYEFDIINSIYDKSCFIIALYGLPISYLDAITKQDQDLKGKIDWGGEARLFHITSIVARFENSSLTVIIKGTNPIFMFKRHASFKSYEKMLASDIVKEIVDYHKGVSPFLSQNGFNADEVEETTGEMTLLQSGFSDYDFIQSRVLPKSRVGSESINLFFIRNGKDVIYRCKKLKDSQVTLKFERNSRFDIPTIVGNVTEIPLPTFSYEFIPGESAWGTYISTFDSLKESGYPYLKEYETNDTDIPRTFGDRRRFKLGPMHEVSQIQNTVIEELPDIEFELELKTRIKNWSPTRSRLIVPTSLLKNAAVGDLANVVVDFENQESIDGIYMVYAERHIMNTGKDTASSILYLEHAGV